MTALAYPDEGRDVRALVTKDNLVEYGWISTRTELDPDQLRGQKPAPKKAKAKVGPSTQAVQPKTDAPRPPKRKVPATTSKEAASSKSATLPPLTARLGDEEDSSVGPKRPRTESRSTPEVARPAASGEGVKSPQTGAASTAKDSEAPMTTLVHESENSQAPWENSPSTVYKGVLFGEAAQKAFVATEEIFLRTSSGRAKPSTGPGPRSSAER